MAEEKPSYKNSMLSEITRNLTYIEMAAAAALCVICAAKGTGPEKIALYLAPIIGICAPFQSAYLAVRNATKAEEKNGHPPDDHRRPGAGEGTDRPGQAPEAKGAGQ